MCTVCPGRDYVYSRPTYFTYGRDFLGQISYRLLSFIRTTHYGQVWSLLFPVSSCYINIHPREGKSFKHFHKNKNPRNTNFTIGGFLAGLPRSPLILCLLFQDFQVLSDHWHLGYSTYWFHCVHRILWS